MSSVLIISPQESGLSLARGLTQEGHIVKVLTQLEAFQGNPSSVSSPGLLDQYDLILTSSSPGHQPLPDTIRQSGKKVLGGGGFNDKVKMSEDYLNRVRQVLMKLDSAPEGRLSVSGWFDGKEFKDYYTCSLMYDRLMEGNRGPWVGSSGSVTWPIGHCQLIESALHPLQGILAKLEYTGPISALCSVEGDELKIARLRADFQDGDLTLAWAELLKGSLFDFLWSTLNGASSPEVRDDYSISVKMTYPPYPYNGVVEGGEMNLEDLLDVNDKAQKHVFLCGEGCILGCVTARGKTVQEARRRVYRTLGNIVKDEEVQYRNDIGAGVEAEVEKLKVGGWINA